MKMDRENVIARLRDVRTIINDGCNKRGTELPGEMCEACVRWIDKALILLFSENEAVKPKSKTRKGATTQVQHWCGNCMAMLHEKPKFCSNCGRQVKWE